MTIRKAVEAEIDILLGFEQGVVDAERPFTTTLKDGTIHYYDIIDLIKSDKAEVLVAVSDNEIIGSGYAKIMEAKPYRKFKEFAYLGFMYVKPEYRGKGINKMIIDSLIEWAKSRDLTEVQLDVYDENTSAKKAYEKVGFKPHLLEMRMEI
ncbi:GNAT family N-acetyltransferase [Mangrovivirga cuniculi]|uniref:GNAT family N-acetyltransferase n=1 Tax=Mangrovivirga cuniculi TaxID=2715131 RepID=A0A4D7JY38_9BACT|nr:GNAT family N-acetyltransferase [Mangrovivirga cuniculi]